MTQKPQKGIIVKSVGGLYGVRPVSLADGDPGETIPCRARGVFRHDKITPVVGDHVVFMHSTQDNAQKKTSAPSADHVIDEILPRSNVLIRPPLANLTHLFVVIPTTHPAPDMLTADKLISIAEYHGIEPVVVINKCDLDKTEAERLAAIYKKHFSTFTLSSATGEGINEFYAYLKSLSKTSEATVIAAFAGVSGAGKSTLMTTLFPELSLKSGELSRKIARGKNTTRHCQLYPVFTGDEQCLIADTPGFSLLDFTRFNFYPSAELPYLFREFDGCLGNCRYSNCTHTSEEECAVLADVHAGNISTSRHESYVAIYNDLKKKPDWKRKQEAEQQ